MIEFLRFGWFYGRNGTSWGDGVTVMWTGRGGAEGLGAVVTWNGKDRRGEKKLGKCTIVEFFFFVQDALPWPLRRGEGLCQWVLPPGGGKEGG